MENVKGGKSALTVLARRRISSGVRCYLEESTACTLLRLAACTPSCCQPRPFHRLCKGLSLLIKGACTNCRAELTPMCPHLTLHFKNVFSRNMPQRIRRIERGCMQPRYYGEALTSDEVFERLLGDKSTKSPSKKKRRRSPPHEEEETASSTNATQTGANSEGIHLRVV